MRGERGMTLLELLVVLAVLGLVSGLAATAYGGRAARQQERWIAELSLLLRAARQEAMGSGNVVVLALGEDSAVAQPSRRPLKLRTGAATRLHWAADDPAGRSTPTFFPDGSAAAGVLVVDNGAGRRRIEIDWLGGIREANAQR
jgi:type II secretion system protein H